MITFFKVKSIFVKIINKINMKYRLQAKNPILKYDLIELKKLKVLKFEANFFK